MTSPAPDFTSAWLLIAALAFFVVALLLRHQRAVRELREAYLLDELAQEGQWVTQPVPASQATLEGVNGVGVLPVRLRPVGRTQ